MHLSYLSWEALDLVRCGQAVTEGHKGRTAKQTVTETHKQHNNNTQRKSLTQHTKYDTIDTTKRVKELSLMTKQEQSMQYSIVVCMVCVILGALMLMGVVVSHYINASKVEDTEVTKECWIYTDYDNTTVFEDADGNLWEIQAHFPDIDVPYAVTFDTQGTEDLTDDVIVGITWAR